MWWATAASVMSQGTVSKNFRMSRSTTQSFRQHRSRQTPNASWAERPGRYPYESRWNTGSTSGSRYERTTVWAIRCATVGTPSTLEEPSRFGISTARTGGGK